MAVGDTYEVTASSLYVRSGPGTSYSILGGLVKGQTVVEKESSSGWIKHSTGWSSGSYLKLIKKATVNTTTTNPSNSGVSASQKQTNNEEAGLDSDGDETTGATVDPDTITNMESSQAFENYVNSASAFYDIDSVIGTFGLPYQFLPSVDTRTNMSTPFGGNNTGIGMEYADKIVGKIPLLFIAPGRPNFMTKFSRTDKETVLSRILSDVGEAVSSVTGLEDLITGEGKYYTFDYAVNEYYSYVNPMCRIAARYLELQDFNLGGFGGGGLDTIDWSAYTMGHIKGLIESTTYANIPFYLDADSSISEDFGNSTGESSLASTVNGISDMGRELRFLTGYGSAALDSDWFSQNADTASYIENLDQTITDILGHGSFITNLSKHLSTVAAGGRLIFPKIWTDSDVSRSYNVKIKLVSPDCNKLSIFLNVLVPLFHLIGLVAPQSVANNPNGYTNPFIVRAMYKGAFNVDMGIITSMSVDKGGACQWTVDGIPTSIEVSLTIKDLYDVFSISKTTLGNWKYDTMSNTAQMDYIANCCGINMYKPEIARQVSMWLVNELYNNVVDIPRNIWRGINQGISKGVMNIFRGV